MHRDPKTGRLMAGGPIPPAIVHGWAILSDLQADTARLCRAPLAIIKDPGDLNHKSEPEAFKARRIVAAVLRMNGVPLPTIGQMLDRDHTSILNGVRQVESTPLERQAAEQLALKYAPQDVAS